MVPNQLFNLGRARFVLSVSLCQKPMLCAAQRDDSCRLASYCSRQGPWLEHWLIAHDYLLWLPALLRADGGRGLGDPRPGLTGRFRGGEATVMPLASSLGASHDFQSDGPLFVNSCMQQQLVMSVQISVYHAKTHHAVR